MELRILNKLLAPLKRQMRQAITRGIVRLVDTDTLFTELQVVALDGETLGQVELFEQYGVTSHPQNDAECVLLSLNGKRSHTIAFAAGNRAYRLRGLAKGEIALYDDLGNVVWLKRDRILVDSGDLVEVKAPEVKAIASTKITLDSPIVECTNQLQVAGMATVGGLSSTGLAGASSITGDLVVTGGDVTADGITLKTHTHPGDSGGTTGAPQ